MSTSLLAVGLGDETTAVAAQDAAVAELPATSPRFATHLETDRGLMPAPLRGRHGRHRPRPHTVPLPPEKHSLTPRMLMAEVERS